MIIYELRAYIGATKTLYSATFADMEAAKTDAKRLQELTAVNGVELHGKITPLQPQNGKFEPIIADTIFLPIG